MAAPGDAPTPVGDGASAPQPLAVMRSGAYLRLLVLAVVLGVPIAAAAFGFLKLTALVQQWAFTDLPQRTGVRLRADLVAAAGRWRSAGLLVGLTVRYLPGRGGESPADGFVAGRPAPAPAALPGIVLAALASVGLGAVVGPEAPLIALGGGLAYLAVRLAGRDLPPRAVRWSRRPAASPPSAPCSGRRWPVRSCCWRPRRSAGRSPPPCCCPGCWVPGSARWSSPVSTR